MFVRFAFLKEGREGDAMDGFALPAPAGIAVHLVEPARRRKDKVAFALAIFVHPGDFNREASWKKRTCLEIEEVN
jgi:hypothetical protein